MQSVLKTPDPVVDVARLQANTFVRHVEIHDALGSTNDRAAVLARDGNVELPALVVARLQTAGKGRGRNKWWSADGALTFSIVLDAVTAGVAPMTWPQLSLATAVAICDALAIELADGGPGIVNGDGRAGLGIKWPNDVLIDGGKVCGILIESPGGAAPAKNRLIIGIGINVNNSWRTAPNVAGSNGAAVCDFTNLQHDLTTVLTNVLIALAVRINQIRAGDLALVHAWQSLDLVRGKDVSIETDGRLVEGKSVEIAHDGALVVDTSSGRLRLYSGTLRLASKS
jgi:BirA family biotin operon repressor/biotin-[acetyl-CoA-carboxylase] ligase